ncbi:hypothetical protein HPP92_019457 [Vanilla planifolia]|uniref:Uncharacterized protein n=1 Tax=Vanilla planifolia TaxID=51239 RepID=A0A835UJ67_VANPL|nr:hypothetical protein HPP92_019457 [Vanilla planifolia]
MAAVADQAQMRKGPWTEQEDVQLDFYVRLFGERRWDFIAKVSGLNRTGKSCRLRWLNYLHPGLKHGRMTSQEEQLILDLHATWGNRWSSIARRLPGRTDNEIKNYWRTHMRKKAQEKRNMRVSSTDASSISSSQSSLTEPMEIATSMFEEEDGGVMGPSMDQIWNELAVLDARFNHEGCEEEDFDQLMQIPPMGSLWNYSDTALETGGPGKGH